LKLAYHIVSDGRYSHGSSRKIECLFRKRPMNGVHFAEQPLTFHNRFQLRAEVAVTVLPIFFSIETRFDVLKPCSCRTKLRLGKKRYIRARRVAELFTGLRLKVVP